MTDTDQLITQTLRDIAAEAGLPGPVADAAWRAGRRRRKVTLAASAASVAAVVAVALSVALSGTSAPGPATRPSPAPSPSRLVSIRLSPVAPASTGTLTDAARLIDRRAAIAHLPDTRAQVAGPDVVLTGPAADAAQLTAIAAPGVLTVREVLLMQQDQVPGAAVIGDARLVNEHTLTLFHKLSCTLGNPTWQYGTNPEAQIVSCDNTIGAKYALAAAGVLGTQIRSAIAQMSPADHLWTVKIGFSTSGASALGDLTTRLYNTYVSTQPHPGTNAFALGSVAFVLDGNVIDAPVIDASITTGVISIMNPGVSRVQARDLAAILQSGPLPVGFRIG